MGFRDEYRRGESRLNQVGRRFGAGIFAPGQDQDGICNLRRLADIQR